ncbi:MAG: hypothetical protein OHK0053_13880 [Microscillaceae bacterium]
MNTIKSALSLLVLSFLTLGSLSAQIINPFNPSGKLDEAKTKADQAVAEDATKAKNWYYRGLIYADIANDQTGLYSKIADAPVQEAYDSYRKAMQLDSVFDDKKQKVRMGRIYEDSKAAIANLHAIAINYSVGRYQEDDLKAAVDGFLLAQITNPNDTIPFMYAADLAYQDERFDVFEKSVQKVLTMDMKNKIRYYALYAFYLKEKDINKALEVATAGLKQDPASDPENYALLSNLQLNFFVETGKVEEAISALKQTVAEAKDDKGKSEAYFNLGVLIEKKLEKEKLTEADLSKAVTDQFKNDEDAAAHGRKLMGRTKEAAEAYQNSIRVVPNFNAAYNLGALYFNLAVEIQKVANNMNLKEYNERGEKVIAIAKPVFAEALKYFEEMYQNFGKYGIDKDERKLQIMRPLQTIYTITGERAKAEELDKKIVAITGEE